MENLNNVVKEELKKLFSYENNKEVIDTFTFQESIPFEYSEVKESMIYVKELMVKDIKDEEQVLVNASSLTLDSEGYTVIMVSSDCPNYKPYLLLVEYEETSSVIFVKPFN